MKRLQSSIWNSLNESALNEKINKDNIEANRIISNPNAGNNAERIKDMGYEVNSNGEKIYSVSNKKTGKTIFPSDYSRDEKKKVDFKNKLDSDRKNTSKISIRPNYAGKGKEIPNSVVIGKDEHGNKVVGYSDYDAYADRASYLDNKPKHTSISKNINDYKSSVETRDENNKNVERYRNKERNYYTKKVDDAQKELDWQDKYHNDKEKEANDAESKRKEILANARAKYGKTNESEELKEGSIWADSSNTLSDLLDRAVNELENDELFELLQGMVDGIRDVALEHNIELN